MTDLEPAPESLLKFVRYNASFLLQIYVVEIHVLAVSMD